MIRHSEYFDGRVQSLGMTIAEGYIAVGIMEPGDYTFSTSTEERITVVEGSMKVRLPGADWKMLGPNETFVIPEGASFGIEVAANVAYKCFYK